MQIVIIDSIPESRALLIGRVSEAIRQTELNISVVELDRARIETFEWENACGCLVGPGAFEDLDEIIERVRIVFPLGHIAAVLESQTYASQAVHLHKRLNLQIVALEDLVQIASFLIDCDARKNGFGNEPKGKGVVGFCQMKGGVGCTTLAAGFAACWARHGMSVAAIDFDDVNPQLTAWARVGLVQRTVTSEFLRTGEVPASRINEMVHPVENFEGRLVVVGQPEAYNESFHFKANVLEGAPSASEFVTSLVHVLSNEFDVVVIDMGRSWGVASFATLPLCQSLMLITDDDGMSVRRTLDSFQRLRKESDDQEEFNLDRWSLVLNGFTGKLISPKEIAQEIQEMDLFSAQSNLFTVPFSDAGRQWGAPGQSFFDAADDHTKHVIKKIACNLVPFRYEAEKSLGTKLIRRVQALVSHS